MAENDGPTHKAYRSSVTGHWVSAKFAERHPRTTMKVTVPDGHPVDPKDDAEDESTHEQWAAQQDSEPDQS